jgi:hypothetical protein
MRVKLFFKSFQIFLIIILLFIINFSSNINASLITNTNIKILPSRISSTYDDTFSFKWSYDCSGETTVGPLAADVDFDGDFEVFACSAGEIVCVDGLSGDLIWRYVDSGISSHAPFEIGNIDDGSNLELVVSCYGKTVALNAEDGSVDWINWDVNSMEKHPVILNVGGKTYVYVTCNFQGNPDSSNTGLLWKLDGVDGSVVKQVSIGYPCWGGLSAADVDGDGGYELFLSDRSKRSGYPLDRGMQCYDADTLDLIWFVDDITCSSHCQAIVDVDGDGVLDSVAFNQGSGGVYVVDGSTGAKMPGKCENHLGLTGHSQFSVYDVDLDGNLELVTVWNQYDWVNPAKVWDLGSWSLDATLDVFAEPPRFADVMGDSKLEIIGGSDWKRNPDIDGMRGVKIYDNNYDLIYTLNERAISSTLVQDIDNDGLNELIIISSDGVLKAYDTLAITPSPSVCSESLYYSRHNAGAGIYIPSNNVNQAPMIRNEFPSNNSINVNLDTIVSVEIFDIEGDIFDIVFQIFVDDIWEIIGSYYNEQVPSFTTFIADSSGYTNDFDTIYIWRVIVTDSYGATNQKIFFFTTETNQNNNPPEKPSTPEGPSIGDIGYSYNFFTITNDPDDDPIKYGWDWNGDLIIDEWTNYYFSGIPVNISHKWGINGIYNISVLAEDIYGKTSIFSNKKTIIIEGYNNPPNRPSLPEGPENENINTICYFLTSAIDIDGDILSYGWDWDGDNTIDEWTDYFPSGETIASDHLWSIPGTYNVKVKAKDISGASSDFSPIKTVQIIGDNAPPSKPIKPIGVQNGKVNNEYSYFTCSTDPNDDLIFYLFDWGDNSNNKWEGPYMSNQTIYMKHKWEQGGVYEVKVKTKDIYGAESRYSDSLIIRITEYSPPLLEICNISGSLLFITAKIKNIGNKDIENLEWVIRVENGLLAMSSRKTTDKINIIKKGDTGIITSSALIGFGEILIVIEAYTNPLIKVEKQIEGFVLFPFIELY